MAYLQNIEMNSPYTFIYAYSGINKDNLIGQINNIMASLGYKYLGQGVYQKGSLGMRILFGVFHKYHKYSILVDTSNSEYLRVKVNNEVTNFFSQGGLLGQNQITSELQHISHHFKNI